MASPFSRLSALRSPPHLLRDAFASTSLTAAALARPPSAKRRKQNIDDAVQEVDDDDDYEMEDDEEELNEEDEFLKEMDLNVEVARAAGLLGIDPEGYSNRGSSNRTTPRTGTTPADTPRYM